MIELPKLSRRQFMAALLAGGVVTAEGLWMPGTKLISIPESTIVMPSERMVRIMLLGSGKQPLPVGVNGKVVLLPYGKPVEILQRYVDALQNALVRQIGSNGWESVWAHPFKVL